MGTARSVDDIRADMRTGGAAANLRLLDDVPAVVAEVERLRADVRDSRPLRVRIYYQGREIRKAAVVYQIDGPPIVHLIPLDADCFDGGRVLSMSCNLGDHDKCPNDCDCLCHFRTINTEPVA